MIWLQKLSTCHLQQENMNSKNNFTNLVQDSTCSLLKYYLSCSSLPKQKKVGTNNHLSNEVRKKFVKIVFLQCADRYGCESFDSLKVESEKL